MHAKSLVGLKVWQSWRGDQQVRVLHLPARSCSQVHNAEGSHEDPAPDVTGAVPQSLHQTKGGRRGGRGDRGG